jgi:hypothetical protein
MKTQKILLAIVLLLAALSLSPALEMKSGIVKAVIDEGDARVSLYKLVDPAKGRYEPLIFDVDPRTSFLTLSFDGRQAKLGDSGDYSFTVRKTDTGAAIEFRSAFCVVVESIDFVVSNGSALADGFRFTFTMTNASQTDAEIGLRFLVDTCLGEKSAAHFLTDLQPKIAAETGFGPGSGDSWIESMNDKAALMVVLRGSGYAPPDRVVFANWKRLNEEPWLLEPVAGRSFTLLPYSVNDSALALYWQPATVAKGESRKSEIILGVFNANGYPVAGTEAASSALYAQTVTAPPSGSADAMAQDLLVVRDLVARIDQAIASGRLSAEELAAWQQILDRLEARMKGY